MFSNIFATLTFLLSLAIIHSHPSKNSAGGGFKLKKINFNKSIDTKARNKKLFVKLFRNHLCQEEKFFFDRKIEEKYISKYFSKNYLASKMKKAKQDFFQSNYNPQNAKIVQHLFDNFWVDMCTNQNNIFDNEITNEMIENEEDNVITDHLFRVYCRLIADFEKFCLEIVGDDCNVHRGREDLVRNYGLVCERF